MKPTLANLYRQATRRSADTLPDADSLLALTRGERPADAERIVSGIAQSALQSDLLHFARALEPASSALADDLANTCAETGHSTHRDAHVRRQRVRSAAGRRATVRRIALGLAAAFVAAIALWQQHRPATPLAIATQPDRIFSEFEDRSVATNQPDEIFNGSFHNDVIFRASGG